MAGGPLIRSKQHDVSMNKQMNLDDMIRANMDRSGAKTSLAPPPFLDHYRDGNV